MSADAARPETAESVALPAVLASPFDAICALDEDGRFEYVNPAFVAICGWRMEDLIGKGFMKLIPPDWHRLALDRWNEALHGGGVQFETEAVTAEGKRLTLIVSQWRVAAGDTFKIACVAKDITAARRIEREKEQQQRHLEGKVQQRTAALVEINARLSRSEAALVRAQATTRIGSWECELGGARPEWSQEMFRLHGLAPAPVAPTVEEVVAAIHPADRDQVMRLMWNAINACTGFRSEHRIVQRGGRVIEVLALADVTVGANGKAQSIAGTLQDITERRRMEREIVEASRHEQQRIGRDIHDTLGQELSGLALMAKALEKQIHKTDPALARRAAAISKLAGEAAAHARDIAHGLSPVDIVAEGLSTELRRLSERVRSRYGTDCRFTASGDDRVHDHVMATHLYHIVQEAVTNAIKHASPSSIAVEMKNGEEGLLEITDNGAGIVLPLDDKAGGIGLRIMRHRAEIIGARLTIAPLPVRGTRVSCAFPNRIPSG